MSFPLLFVGLLLVVVAARDTYKDLGALLYGDFTGAKNFWYWLASIAIVGAVGYYAPWRNFSRLFLVLLLLVFVLANRNGLFANLVNALQSGPIAAKPKEPTLPTDIPIEVQALGVAPIYLKATQKEPLVIKVAGQQQGGTGGLGGIGGQ